MTFGERIILLRKQRKWSQEQLAKQIGTSAPIVGRYERGEIKPSIDTAKSIADALDVTVDYLLGGTEQFVLDKALLKRLEAIESLPQGDKYKVYYLIDVVLRDAKARQTYAG